jgi:hypothetical protein
MKLALKKMKLSKKNQGLPASSLREVVLLKSLLHPNIVKYHHYELESKISSTTARHRISRLLLNCFPSTCTTSFGRRTNSASRESKYFSIDVEIYSSTPIGATIFAS